MLPKQHCFLDGPQRKRMGKDSAASYNFKTFLVACTRRASSTTDYHPQSTAREERQGKFTKPTDGVVGTPAALFTAVGIEPLIM